MFNSQAVKDWLVSNERTASWLARKAGIGKLTMLRALAGHKPSLETVVAVSRATGLSMNRLVSAEVPADAHVNQPSDWSRDLPAPAAERAPQPTFRYGGPGTCEWCKMPKERCDCKERCKILTPEDERARDTNTDGKLMRHLRGEVWPS